MKTHISSTKRDTQHLKKSTENLCQMTVAISSVYVCLLTFIHGAQTFVCVCVRVNEIRPKGKEQIRRSYRKDRKPKRLAAPSQIHTLTPNDLSKDLFGMQHVNTAINICAGDAAYTLVYATPANSECECDGIKKE